MFNLKVIAYSPFNSNSFACAKDSCHHSFDFKNYLKYNSDLIETYRFFNNKEAQLAMAAKLNNNYGLINLEFACLNCNYQKIIDNLLSLINSQGPYLGIRTSLDKTCEFTSILNELINLSDSKSTEDVLVVICHDYGQNYNKTTLSQAIKQIKAIYKFTIALEVSHEEEINLANELPIDFLILKGHEAAGFSSSKTSYILSQEMAKNLTKPYFIDGGSAENSIYSLSLAQASGVVLNSILSLCQEANACPNLTHKIVQSDASESISQSFSTDLNDTAYYRYFTTKVVLNNGTDNSNITKQQLIQNLKNNTMAILGQDIAFAKYYQDKFPTYQKLYNYLVDGFNDTKNYLRDNNPLSINSPLAQFHQTKYPIVQGAMTRVSDNANFARAVYDNGGLPFLALALMRKTEAENLLKSTVEIFNGHESYGVGILGFIPAEIRNEQLDLILKYKPRFVLIAGGRPDQAIELENNGITTYLHVPSPNILKTSIEANCRKFIFEGQECGGHVGPRTSLVLWQSMIHEINLAIKNGINPEEFHIILAGGIHDELSGAMAGSILASLAKARVKVGVLMGTAYLYTNEATLTEAITTNFQSKAIEANQTVLIETGPGHLIRCIKSPYYDYFNEIKNKLISDGKPKDEVRVKLELMNLGRLRIASKGLGKTSENSQLEKLDDESQWLNGMYMIGQVASQNTKIISMAQLHERVCLGSYKIIKNECLETKTRKFAKKRERLSNDGGSRDIAIIGMACNFPKASDSDKYWENIINLVDTITEIPASHFKYQNFYDSDKMVKDKIYSKWGGFLDHTTFDPSLYGIPPNSLPYIDPVQLLTLDLVRQALIDSNYKDGYKNDGNNVLSKTSVVVAHAGHGPITALYSLRSMLEWKLHDLPKSTKDEIYNRLPAWTEDVFPGYLGNVIAGRVANRFDFNGVNFSVDAACASSLAGLYTAILELRSKNSDLVILAGADTHNQPGDYLSFSKTYALSPTGKCKTFDASADGIVISEGLGVIILKRLDDAINDGDKVYAVIKGIGGSSDGRDLSLTAPRKNGQIIALNRAYSDSNINPKDVNLIEAHGTGTVAGDKAELEALSEVFTDNSPTPNCAIGSVKTMIGHTKAAAGVASLIKIAKALHHKTMPASINVSKPVIDFNKTNFYLNTHTKPWFTTDTNKLRKAGVSAFGFGGTNFHCVLEEYPYNNQNTPAIRHLPEELFVFKSDSLDKLKSKLENFVNNTLNTNVDKNEFINLSLQTYLSQFQFKYNLANENTNFFNVAILADSDQSLKDKIAFLLARLNNDQTSATEIIDEKEGVYFKTLKGKAKLSLLFSGQGSQYPNMLSDFAIQFDFVRKVFELGDHILKNKFDKPLSQYIYPNSAFTKEEKNRQINDLANTAIAQPAVALADAAMFALFTQLGLEANMYAGHSFGEYVALYASGCMNLTDLIKLSFERGNALNQNTQNGTMIACIADNDRLSKLLTNSNITIANINSPRQSILAGLQKDIDEFINNNPDLNFTPVKVSQPFHSQYMETASQDFKLRLKRFNLNENLKLPVYKNIDGQIYENNSDLIKNNLVEHITHPVNFINLIQNQYNDGARIFLEIGPGSVLTNMVKDILPNNDVTCLNFDNNKAKFLNQLQKSIAKLFINNFDVKLDVLYENRIKPNSNNTNFKQKYLLNSVECIKSNDLKTNNTLSQIDTFVFTLNIGKHYRFL